LKLEKGENHANTVGFGFYLFETATALEIIQSDMTRATAPLSLPAPIQVLPKPSGANTCEANPQKAIVQWKQATAPA